MTNEDALKIEDIHPGDQSMETAVVKGTHYVREHDGTWRYANNWIEVPGARDLTLTERFRPKVVIASTGSGAEVERVIVASEDIAAHPDLLDWCLVDGSAVRGPEGELIEVLVPIQAWNEHNRIPEEIIAPEHSDNPAERELAEAEREYREADRMLEIAATKRAEILRRYAGEMTRQEARAITDLSVGRIQQLIRSDDENELDPIDRTLLQVVETRRPKSVKALHELAAEENGVLYPTVLIRRRIQGLQNRDLITRSSRGFQLTSEGRDALLALSGTPPDGGAD